MAEYGMLDQALAGLLEGLGHDIESKIVIPTAGINYGDAVFYDAGDEDGAYAPNSTDTSLVFGGVAVLSHRADAKSGVAEIYAQYDQVSVCRSGCIWVPCVETATTAQAPAYLVNDTTSANYGKFSTTSTSNYATGCYFRSEPIDGLVLLEVRGLK